MTTESRNTERGRDGLREERCAFCPIIEGDAPANIIERGERHIAFVPLGPHVPGHVLFVPTEHLPDATTNPERAGSVLAEAARYVAEQGIEANIITSVGPAATQSVPHLHVHVIPRGADDGLPARWPWIPEPQCTCGDAFAANQWWHLPDCPRHPLDRRILAEHPATGDEERGCRECGPGCLGHTAPPASDVDSDNAAAGGAEGLAEVLCLCHETVCPIHNEAAGLTAEYDVQSLMNALAAHVAQAKAEALREAADAIWQREGGYTGGVQWGRADYAGWLRDRADRIAGGGA
jgi:histidine triad (HIT) family protein